MVHAQVKEVNEIIKICTEQTMYQEWDQVQSITSICMTEKSNILHKGCQLCITKELIVYYFKITKSHSYICYHQKLNISTITCFCLWPKSIRQQKFTYTNRAAYEKTLKEMQINTLCQFYQMGWEQRYICKLDVNILALNYITNHKTT